MRNESIFWNAVKNNDARFDGVFFTGVKTTGIYCRPSCGARLPKRENVTFFQRREEALNGGFRACLRCKPDEVGRPSEKTKTAVRIAELIDSEGTSDLKFLSSEVDMSPSHLQRLFKEIIGVSPRKFLEYKKLDGFRKGTREGKEVVDAMYDSGFESSSRLYEDSNKKMGMTPATYKKGGKDMTINYSVADCGLGKLLVAATPKGICAVKVSDNVAALTRELKEEFKNAIISHDSSLLKHFVDAVLGALEGKSSPIDLPLDLKATAFQMKVWEELRRIPFGETITYAELARRIGNEKSVRAVANACAKNSAAIVIPCHRVIGSDGSLRGYRWGLERKRKILQIENPEFMPERSLFG